MMLGISLESALGLIYVTAWCISMYSPVLTNLKYGSANGVSVDFVVLNTLGYFFLVCSMILQMFFWVSTPKQNIVLEDGTVASIDNRITQPKLSTFDLIYCCHGELLNLVLLTQIIFAKQIWGFYNDHHRRMKPIYYKIFMLSVCVFTMLTGQFTYFNYFYGWNNNRTLQFCNNLFFLKITMSLIKYIPQVKHNHERRSTKGFSIVGVMLDITGGVASLLQLIIQLSKENGFSWSLIVLNFGKIGLSFVTLLFCSIFISQWLMYGE